MRIAALQMHAIAGDGDANLQRIAAAAAAAGAGDDRDTVIEADGHEKGRSR